jgi:hypothetical protein
MAESSSESWNAWFHQWVCERMNLPPTISRAELCRVQREIGRVGACKRDGLPNTSTWKEIAYKRSRDARKITPETKF